MNKDLLIKKMESLKTHIIDISPEMKYCGGCKSEMTGHSVKLRWTLFLVQKLIDSIKKGN
jgi:hypothetical protein